MAPVEPVANEPAAVAELGAERALVIADYHAGVESALRADGVEVESRADERLDRLLALLDRTGVDRLVVVGDLAHWIGEPRREEHEELRQLLEALEPRVALTLVRGNHDGGIDEELAIETTDPGGVRVGPVGFAHGHTWPTADVLSADVVCVGHEHPTVRLEDSVGGRRVERAWLRGELVPEAFEGHADPAEVDGELVVVPAFNDLVGGAWINVAEQSFLSPFLPEGISGGQAYLLDGTRLGEYRRVS